MNIINNCRQKFSHIRRQRSINQLLHLIQTHFDLNCLIFPVFIKLLLRDVTVEMCIKLSHFAIQILSLCKIQLESFLTLQSLRSFHFDHLFSLLQSSSKFLRSVLGHWALDLGCRRDIGEFALKLLHFFPQGLLNGIDTLPQLLLLFIQFLNPLVLLRQILAYFRDFQ